MNPFKNYCVYDLETTGLSPTKDRIIEIGILRVRDGDIVAEYHTLVNPQQHIPERATAVNHITDDMVQDAPAFADVVADVSAFIGTDTLVGYNSARFDNAFMRAEFGRCGLLFFPRTVDVYVQAKEYAKYYSLKLDSLSLSSLCRHFNIDSSNAHNAIADCRMTKACFDAIFIPVKAKSGDR